MVFAEGERIKTVPKGHLNYSLFILHYSFAQYPISGAEPSSSPLVIERISAS